jgi:hypothetical protein
MPATSASNSHPRNPQHAAWSRTIMRRTAGRRDAFEGCRYRCSPSSAGLASEGHRALRVAPTRLTARRPEPGGPLTLTPETVATAGEKARATVAYLDEEARWALLQKWLRQEPAALRQAGQRSLRLEALRSIVSPRVNDGDWDKVVRKHRPMRWSDELRLANTLASSKSSGRAGADPSRLAIPLALGGARGPE